MPSENTPPPDFGPALKRLGVALVNATLMLVALVLLLAIVLAVQVRGIAQDGRAELRTEIARLEQQIAETRTTAAQALSELEARREAGRGSPGAIRPGTEDLPPELAALQAALTELVERLASLDLPPPDPSITPQTRLDDETFMRWLVLSFIRAVAREILAPETGTETGIAP